MEEQEGVSLAAGGVLLGWAPGLQRLYRREGRARTANVEARRPAAGPRRLLMVVLAHHDSKSQSLSLPWRAGLTFTAIVGTLVLAVALVAAVAAGSPAASSRSATAAGFAAAAALAILSTLKNGNR